MISANESVAREMSFLRFVIGDDSAIRHSETEIALACPTKLFSEKIRAVTQNQPDDLVLNLPLLINFLPHLSFDKVTNSGYAISS